jgi:hypothetical protein
MEPTAAQRIARLAMRPHSGDFAADIEPIIAEAIDAATADLRAKLAANAAFALWGQPAHKQDAAEEAFREGLKELGIDWNGDDIQAKGGG